METYPIVIDGALTGTLKVERHGARTAFDADCAMRDGLIRISVYGEGREGYLGLLAPEGERLTLHRLLSRAELREFPAEIERVERAGLSAEPPQPEEPERSAEEGSACLWLPEELPVTEPQPAEEEPEPPTREAEETSAGAEKEEQRTEPCEQAEENAEDTEADAAEVTGDAGNADDAEAIRWYSSPDGALVSFDGLRSLIALPPEDPRVPPDRPGERRSIEGRDYLVYRTRNGRLEA